MSQNGSSGYYEGDVLLDDDALVSMPEATLIECFGNLAVTKRPAHLRPPAAFCTFFPLYEENLISFKKIIITNWNFTGLPFVSMNNDLTSGHALKHITLTLVFELILLLFKKKTFLDQYSTHYIRTLPCRTSTEWIYALQ